MSSRALSVREMIYGGISLARYLLAGGLFNINLEVTKRCNARCDFCDYWKEPKGEELSDYVPVIKHLKPLSVSLTGGEPLLRKDLEKLIRSIRKSFGFVYISLITNGALLTEERGMDLWNAGLDELSVSLDYMDERHDRERRIKGLTKHILDVAPSLARNGVNMCFNTVIKRSNFRELPLFARYVHSLGIKLSFSTYNWWRVGNKQYTIQDEELEELKNVLETLKEIKRELGHIETGYFYFDRIPEFFLKGGISGCTAGINWVQVTPDGYIKRCSDFPKECHWSEWHKGTFAPTDCIKCWYSCRGAAQEPFTFKRLVEMARETLQ